MKDRLTVGVIGSGAISGIYLENMTKKFSNLEVKCVASAHLENAQKKAAEYGLPACTVDELLADPEIDMAVILTPVGSHYDLIKRALLSGKHVYTEKTMTDDVERSAELLALADEKGLYLGSAPDTFLGSALQTAREAIDDGLIGKVESFNISGNRNNDLLLSFFSFLRQPGAGIMNDYAVYYFTALCSLLGNVRRVGGIVETPYKTHVNILPTSPEFGQVMDTPNESRSSAVILMENGVSGTFHLDSDTVGMDQAHFVIYGSKGMLYLTDPNQFGGEVKLLPHSMDFRKPPQAKVLWAATPYCENSRGIGPSEMADAILSGRPNRASKEMAYHVQEVLAAILSGGEEGRFVDIKSRFTKPEPLGQVPVGVKKLAHLAFNAKNMEAMMAFYRDVLGAKHLFTLTMGDLAKGVKRTIDAHPEDQRGKAFLEKLTALGDLPWIEYMKLADGQFVELFHEFKKDPWADGETKPRREIPDRSGRVGYFKYNLEVESIEALKERLMAAGIAEGEIHGTADGSLEISIHDPDGNEIQFTEYGAAGKPFLDLAAYEGAPFSAARGITQLALRVKDAENMKRFYTRGLGFKVAGTLTYGDLAEGLSRMEGFPKEQLMRLKMMADMPWIDYLEVAPRQYIELFHEMGDLTEDRDLSDSYGYQHFCLEVSDIQASFAAVKRNGLTPDTEISKGADGSWQFWLVDPDGNRLELMQYNPDSKQLLPD